MADASRDVTIRQVPTAIGRLQVADHPGDEPALVFMHGFPDDSRIYDRLVPLLSPRRAVAFDFLGYGGSDRPQTTAPDPAGHLLAGLFPRAGLHLVDGASHWPQWDQPGAVAELIR